VHNNRLVLAPVAVQVDIPKEVLRVLEVGVLLRAAETGALVGLVFRLFVRVIGLLSGFPACLFVFCYPLAPALLVCSGFSLGFGLCFGGLGGLLALYFAVFRGVPGVENLLQACCVRATLQEKTKRVSKYIVLFFIIKSATSSNRGRGDALLLFFVCSTKPRISTPPLAGQM
jgi:hypothetical protein